MQGFRDELPERRNAGAGKRPRTAQPRKLVVEDEDDEEKPAAPPVLRKNVRHEQVLGRTELEREPYFWRTRVATDGGGCFLTPILKKVVKGSQLFPFNAGQTCHQLRSATLALLDGLAKVLAPRSLQRNDEKQSKFIHLELPSADAFRYPAAELQQQQKKGGLVHEVPICMEYDLGQVRQAQCLCHVKGVDAYLRVYLGTDAGGKPILERAHRIILGATRGEAPDGKPHVLHTCHNSKCLSPRHLRYGDAAQNAKDREDRKKSRGGKRKWVG